MGRGRKRFGQLGLGDTVDRYQLVRNPYFGPDATTNSVSMEVSCVATNDAKGYRGMGNTHYFCITHNGDVYAFGWGGNGFSWVRQHKQCYYPYKNFWLIKHCTNICGI